MCLELDFYNGTSYFRFVKKKDIFNLCVLSELSGE